MIFGVKNAFEADIVVKWLNKLHKDWKEQSPEFQKTRRVSCQSVATAEALEALTAELHTDAR